MIHVICFLETSKYKHSSTSPRENYRLLQKQNLQINNCNVLMSNFKLDPRKEVLPEEHLKSHPFAYDSLGDFILNI